MTPGFSTPVGSQSALNSAKAARRAGLNWRSRRAPRARPSPCSPERDPPWETTSDAAAAMKRSKRSPAAGAIETEADAEVHTALPEVPVGDAWQVVRRAAAREGRAGTLPSRRGGTAESSKPGQAALPSASRDVWPAPSSRIRHRAACSAVAGEQSHVGASSRRPTVAASRSAWSCASTALSPRASTKSHAPPAGRPTGIGRCVRQRAAAPPESDSTVKGAASRSAGTASAPATSSAQPRTSSIRVAGGRTSRRVARPMSAQVPSLPARARATSAPRSGRSQSSA